MKTIALAISALCSFSSLARTQADIQRAAGDADATSAAASTIPTPPRSAAPLDDFESLSAWRLIASDGVTARVSSVEGVRGRALRLDFDFERGSGFCVIHRDIALALPTNYRFALYIRGEAPPNNLEFKLLDTSGDNVWWVNRRNFEFPADWQKLTNRARHFQFAWGPAGGGRPETLGAIEFAVAAASGGRGYVIFDELTFEPLPEMSAAQPSPRVHCSTSRDGPCERELPESGALNWASAANDAQPCLDLDLQDQRELGGLAIDWDRHEYATEYAVSYSDDGQHWSPPVVIRNTTGGPDYLALGPAEARYVRLTVRSSSHERGVAIARLRVLGPEFAESPNLRYALIARESPRGWFPRYFLGEQEFWTVVGAPDHDREALVGTSGAVEVDRGAFRLEPFLHLDGSLITWADADIRVSLEDGYLPIPSVTWRAAGLELVVTALVAGTSTDATLYIRYRLTNTRSHTCRPALYVALRPFQVLPPWHELNIAGGVARVHKIAWHGTEAVVNDVQRIIAGDRSATFGATTSGEGEVVRFLARGTAPAQTVTCDPAHLASGAWRHERELAPGESIVAVFALPYGPPTATSAAASTASMDEHAFDVALQRAARQWAGLVRRAELRLPPEADRLARNWRTAQAHILINADGAALQPGSRTYERSWIRDGALIATALLYAGHPERVRAFVDWYCQHQYPNGKVPCVVDRRGPDPVPEHDSTGQLIYTLLKYYRFTRDQAFLADHLQNVAFGVDYIDALRAERMTDAYCDGPPDKRACYGLVPESISHEGYSAKPMHSYWDSFWVLRGLKDTATIAQVLERNDLAQRFSRLRDEYRSALYDSLRRTMDLHRIDYIPGCVELGDFDATSTSTAVFPCGEGTALPEPARTRTFDRYWEFFCRRRDGALAWENYTPYELRLLSTFVMLGRREQALQMLDFFLNDQSPPEWNQWAEVVWRDRQAPRFIGDLPHTWVAAEFLCGLRTMFVYEREEDGALVLAAGIDPRWLSAPDGIAIKNWPTEYGTVSYELRSRNHETFLRLKTTGDLPPGGIVLRAPLPGRIARAELAGQPLELGDAEVRIRALEGDVTVVSTP